MTLKPEPTNFPTIQALRAIAALSVCWVHFTQWTGPDGITRFPDWLRFSGAYGWLGVEAFFVISGFIVPYSLIRGGYRINDFFVFLWKRIVRVDPPYIVSMAVAIILAVLASRSSIYKGAQPHFSIAQIAFHFGYLIPFVQSRGYDWVNQSFWTLGIEFQFYVALAFLFPLIASKTQSVRFSSFLLLCGVPFIPLGPLIQGPSFLPHYTPLFLMGIAGMLRKVGVSTRKEFWLTTILAVVSSFASMDERGLPETIVGVVTLVCILNMKSAPIVMLLIGDISYSLYVIHQPIGGRVVNLGVRFVPHFFSSIVPFVAVFIVLIAAYLMYTFVELPAKRWAARFRYAPISSDPGMPAEKNVGHVTNMGFKKAE